MDAVGALLQGNLVLEQALQMVRHYFCCLSGGQLSAEEVAAFTSVFQVSLCCSTPSLLPQRLSMHPLAEAAWPAASDDRARQMLRGARCKSPIACLCCTAGCSHVPGRAGDALLRR